MSIISQLKKLSNYPFVEPGTVVYENHEPGTHHIRLQKGRYRVEVAGSGGRIGSIFQDGNFGGNGELKSIDISLSGTTEFIVIVAGDSVVQSRSPVPGYILGGIGQVSLNNAGIYGGGGGSASAFYNLDHSIENIAHGGGGGGSYNPNDTILNLWNRTRTGGQGSSGALGGAAIGYWGFDKAEYAGNGLGGQGAGITNNISGWIKITRL